MARNKKRTRKITIKAPKHFDPGKGRPIEELAYISPREKRALLRSTDHTAEMTRHGILSFADDSASSMGVSRGDTSQGTVGSNSGASKMGSSSSQSGGTKSSSTGGSTKSGAAGTSGGPGGQGGGGAGASGPGSSAGNPGGGGGANAGGNNAGNKGTSTGGGPQRGELGGSGGNKGGQGANAGGGGLLGANRAMESGFGPGRVSPTGTRGPGTQNSPSFTTPDRPITGSLADNPTRALLGPTQKPFNDRLSQKEFPTDRVPQDENLTQVAMFDPNRPVGLPKSTPSLPSISRNPFDLTAPLPARVPNYPAVDPYPGEYPGRGFVSPTAMDIAAMTDKKKSPYGNVVSGPDDDPHADPMYTPPHGEYSDFQNPVGLPRTTTAQPLSALPGGPLRDDRMDPAPQITTPGITNPSRLGPPSPNVEVPDTSWEAQQAMRRIAEVRSMNTLEKQNLFNQVENMGPMDFSDPNYMTAEEVGERLDEINRQYPMRGAGIISGEPTYGPKQYAGFPDLSQTDVEGPRARKQNFAGEFDNYVETPKTSMLPDQQRYYGPPPSMPMPLTGQTIPKAGTKKTYERILPEAAPRLSTYDPLSSIQAPRAPAIAQAPQLPNLQQPAYGNPTPVPTNWGKIVNDLTGPPKPYNPLSSIQTPRDIIARSEVPDPNKPLTVSHPPNPTVGTPALVGQAQPPRTLENASTYRHAADTNARLNTEIANEEQADFQRQIAETEIDPAIREYTTVQPETDMTPGATQRIIERYGEDGVEIARLVNLVNSATGKRSDTPPPLIRRKTIPMLEA